MNGVGLRPCYRVAVGYFEGLRRLGFSSSQIRFVLQTKQKALFTVLEHNKAEFICECGPLDLSYEQFTSEWTAIVEAINDGTFPQEDLDTIWHESLAHKYPGKFVVAMATKGIYPINKQN